MEENKNENVVDTNADTENKSECENSCGGCKCTEKEAPEKKKTSRKSEAELLKQKEIAEKATAERDEAIDKYQRTLAEYDNFRKRTQKEKEGIYTDAYGEALKELLPIIDNLERAVNFPEGENLLKGLKMTLTQCENALNKLGVEVIDPKVGEPFDPDQHNAVMHAEDENYGENTIVAVLQKGYKKGEKVFRYAMVSVVN